MLTSEHVGRAPGNDGTPYGISRAVVPPLVQLFRGVAAMAEWLPLDHSTISRTRRLIDLETHEAVFTA